MLDQGAALFVRRHNVLIHEPAGWSRLRLHGIVAWLFSNRKTSQSLCRLRHSGWISHSNNHNAEECLTSVILITRFRYSVAVPSVLFSFEIMKDVIS